MSNKLISLAIAATLAITGTSAYAASAASVISSMQTAKPLQMGVADRDGLIKYKGKTVIAGVLEYNLVNEARCQACITVGEDSEAMIPKKTNTSYATEFAVEADNPNINALKLDKNKCWLVPMVVEIDGYYSDGYEGGMNGANLTQILRTGKAIPTSCNN